MNITPAILTDSFLTLQQQVNAVQNHPGIEAVQIDVVDAMFAENITVTPLDLTVGEYEPLKLDFHFMTEEPLDFVYECEGVKEYLPIRRIYGQVERMTHQHDFLWAVQANQWQAGLALDLFTPLEAIDDEVWPELRYILLMAVEAGAQRQHFQDLVLEKVKELRELTVGTKLHILIDGGIRPENFAKVAAAGADEAAVGSFLWESQDPATALDELLSVA